MNYRRILPFFAALSLVLSACGQAPQGGGSTLQDGAASGSGETRPAGAVLTCRIVDGAADGRLLLADLDGTANGVYTLPVGEIPVTVDGENATAADLADGMLLKVEYSGDVLETYPAQLANVSALRAQTASLLWAKNQLQQQGSLATRSQHRKTLGRSRASMLLSLVTARRLRLPLHSWLGSPGAILLPRSPGCCAAV